MKNGKGGHVWFLAALVFALLEESELRRIARVMVGIPLAGIVLTLFLASSAAGAATLVVSGGQLMGATGVDVNGQLYNVEFHGTTCIDLFNGCDATSDFAFQTEASALLASQALFDQVLVDGAAGDFDTFPELTNGCTISSVCFALTPYAVSQSGTFDAAFARNYGSEVSDYVSTLDSLPPDRDYANVYVHMTLAVWSSVPEPSTGLLLGLGLSILSLRRRRSAEG